MALITCPECGRQVSDTSRKCIQCGADIELVLRRRAQEAADAEKKRFLPSLVRRDMACLDLTTRAAKQIYRLEETEYGTET